MNRITSAQNPLIKHLVKLRQSRSYRYAEKCAVISGVNLIREISEDCSIKTLLVSDASLLPKKISRDLVFFTNDAIISKVTGVQTPEGIAAEVIHPPQASLKGLKRLIALDSVSDPGNMGTLLRTALALGWDGAFILENSCDLYNDKALRAAKGATFRLPIRQGNWHELQQLITENKWVPFAGDIEGIPLEKISLEDAVVLVLGNEAHGISEEAKTCCQKVTIPMSGKMESLNVAVAGGILMYSMRNSKDGR